MKYIELPGCKISRILFESKLFGWFWLPLRVWLGWTWLGAGWHKFQDPAWVGADAGKAVSGFFKFVIMSAGGDKPTVSGWYASFIQNAAVPSATFFSYLITFGEIAVGLGLILGAFTAAAAFFAIVMNLNFLFSGVISTNPILITAAIPLLFAWRNAGWVGLDRWILPMLKRFGL